MNKLDKKGIITLTSSVLVFAFGLIGFSSMLVQHNEDTSYSSWMNKLSDDTALRDVSMPGSHDTMALYSIGNLAGQCQSLSLNDQLKLGVRFLDIRLKESNDQLKAVHGFIDQKATFSDIYLTTKVFLKNHPSEFIIMSIKEEADPSNSTVPFEQVLGEYYKDTIFLKDVHEVPNTIKDLRGKILLLSRYNNPTYGIPAYSNWKDSCSFLMEDTDIYVQDTYKISDSDTKKSEIVNCFNTSGHKLKINFLSAYKTNYIPPSYAPSAALDVNPWINIEISNYKDRGIVLYDFVSKSNMDAFFKGIL